MADASTRRRTRFRDRRAAGVELAAALADLRAAEPVVVGLPRGGVVVADEVARALEAPLDVVIVRKLGAPSQPEFAVGALGEEGVVVVDEEAVDALALRGPDLDRVVERERAELERRSARFRAGAAPLPVAGRTVLLVDDGIATGSTARAAARVLRRRGAARIVLAVPVGPPDVRARFAGDVDAVVCLERPRAFFAVGQAYDDFAPTSDEEVEQLLRAASRRPDDGPRTRELQIPIPGGALAGTLAVPSPAHGLVLFAHGSGSSRRSPRNVRVAADLQAAGLATLLFDLLTRREAQDRANVFDIDLLAERLVAATRAVTADTAFAGLGVGYFGASTGAAAALCAAAELGDAVAAVVSRGGRPDLAAHRLAAVTAPTLLVVGGDDRAVLELNERAARLLRCPHELAVVAGATHLFEEPGTLEEVSRLATAWFAEHLVDAGARGLAGGRPASAARRTRTFP